MIAPAIQALLSDESDDESGGAVSNGSTLAVGFETMMLNISAEKEQNGFLCTTQKYGERQGDLPLEVVAGVAGVVDVVAPVVVVVAPGLVNVRYKLFGS